MAVYTHVGPHDVAALLDRYDAGELITLKGIAEGIENSNYFVETTRSRFILTLYENRVDPTDLPFFHNLLNHLHKAGCKVPCFMDDKDGTWLHQVAGRSACLIEFLSGVSVTQASVAQARATGAALGNLHAAVSDFAEIRPNSLGIDAWRPLANKCNPNDLERISKGLHTRIVRECAYLNDNWPDHLPRSVIHADLFPDNILMLGDKVSGLIDFYFACTDLRGYDLAITHAAWSFSADGAQYYHEIGRAILSGYAEKFGLDADTLIALPTLLRGACLRFLLTRCYDWVNTPPGALVSRKDPLEFLRRLDFYSNSANIETIVGQID